MAVCPKCGNEVDESQDFCRNCGSSIENVEEIEKARLHLRDKDDYVVCRKISYPSMGGNWVRAHMEDHSVRIYPIDRIEYVEASSGVADTFAEPEPGNVQVKEVNSFDSVSQLLGSISNALS